MESQKEKQNQPTRKLPKSAKTYKAPPTKDDDNKAVTVIELLEQVVPFIFLSTVEKKQLVKDFRAVSFKKGEIIYNKWDSDDSMFLIRKGRVETLDFSASGTVQINHITAGHYFGERSAIFHQKRVYTVKAVSDVECYSISGKNFRKLIHSSKAFSKAMSIILRDKQGIFSAFDRFKSEVLQGISREHIEIRDLLPYYKDMEPALHPFVNDSSEIDIAALYYAIKRLPNNVTENFIYILIDELYEHIPEPWKLFEPVPAEARRRRAWKMMSGQTMMLYRPDITDLLDLITCLCIFTVEAEKIRTRLSRHRTLIVMKNKIAEIEVDKDSKKAENDYLETLPFSVKEMAGLKKVWSEKTLNHIYNVTVHSGIFTLMIKKQTAQYNTRRTEMWLSQLGEAVKTVTGYKPNELPASIKIHIVSSNIHSVLNCLDSSLHEKEEEILKWGKKTNHYAYRKNWYNKQDMLYALAKDFPFKNEETGKIKNYGGIYRLERTASTGIQAQLFSLRKLVGKKIDLGLPEIPKSSRSIIINFDYAFGEQAGEIMRNLLLQFGKNVGSISILGKAGALLGKRGDILLPDTFIAQSEDLFLPIKNRALDNISTLQKRLNKIKIHKGPLLTVDGTILQNSMMLSFYRHMWDCVGLEMEGIYYLRQIIEAQQHGLIGVDTPLSFYYYVSDLPGAKKSQLSTGMGITEGIPPLYAVTREALTNIFLIEAGESYEKNSDNR